MNAVHIQRNLHHRRPYALLLAFTLIELMVVIMIITLLMAMLLPALSSARQSARTTACASQQRQIGVSVMMYCSDYNDYLPNTYAAGGTSWYQALSTNNRLEGLNTYNSSNYLQYAYKLFRCPEKRNYTVPGDSDFDPVVRINYAYNAFIGRLQWYEDWQNGGASWKKDYGSKKLGAVVNPPMALILLDGVGKDWLLINSDKLTTFSFNTITVGSLNRPNPQHVDFRHQDTSNGLFVDGHVTRIPASRWPYSSYTCDWARDNNYTP